MQQEVCAVVAVALAHSGSITWWLCVVPGLKFICYNQMYPLWLEQMLLPHGEVVLDDVIWKMLWQQWYSGCIGGNTAATSGCYR